MPFISLSLYNFRNLKNDRINLFSKEIYFVGENGQGKSNILEALYYSSYGNSFRTRNDKDIIKHGEKDFSIKALFQDENKNSRSISVILKKDKKIIEKNGKKIHDRKELINTMPCVLFNHDDMVFAEGNPESRRFFIDQSLSMYDILYVDVMRKYKKILKNRNVILKNKEYEMLDIYDEKLIENGLDIQKKRKKTIFSFNEIFSKIYEEVSGIEDVHIKYMPSWKELNAEIGTQTPSVKEIEQLLIEKREADKIMGTTMTGPHRDKIIFLKDKKIFIPSASTGQRRLISLVLRVAQAVLYSRITGEKPVLLMDDVMLELDPEKRRKFTAALPDYDQLFCTFLPGEPYNNYKKESTKIFQIKEGSWYE